jgi:adenosylhomocysteinase
MIDGYPDQVISSAYTSIINRFADKKTQEEMRKEIKFIVIGHMVPTLPFYIDALGQVGTVELLVPKNSTPDSETRKWVDEKGFKVLQEKDAREHLRTSWHKYVKTDNNCKIIVIDIGGYFAPAMKEYVKKEHSGVNILGYVEDTENGYQKYFANIPEMIRNCETQAEKLNVEPRSIFNLVPPIISVARSQIKESEDYNVGKAITDATDHVLRTKYYTHLAESKTILVIGYGKIGSAAAQVTSQKTRGPVLVCEIDNVRKLKASAHSFVVVDLFEGLKQADVIISCTGNRCLGAEHIEYIKHNAYISSCTSKDDEFDKSFIDALGAKVSDTDSYSVGSKIINLLNGGNSINFIEKAVHGYFIHGVLASLIVSAITIFKNSKGSLKTALQRSSINDFNDLKDDSVQGGVNESYQSIVAGILMREKLRTGPSVTNFKLTKKKVIPRYEDRKALEKGLTDYSHCLIIGKKKAGKSHVVDQFFYFNKQYYDIAWRFDGSDLDTQYNHLLEELKSVYPRETQNLLASDIPKFLQNSPHPYLLVFENAKEEIPAFPKSAGAKREHVILTTKQESEKLENVKKPFPNVKNHLLLEPYPREELFKLVLDDSEFCKSMDIKIKGLLSKMEKEIQEQRSKDESGPDDASFIPIANIMALYLKYAEEKERELDAISKLDNKNMLLYVIQKLSEKEKKLLFLFHILQRKRVAYLKKEIERRYDTNTIKELIKYGWIEEETDDGEYLVSINLKYYNKVVEDEAGNAEDEKNKLVTKAVTLTLQDYKTENVVARNQVASVVRTVTQLPSLGDILRVDASPNQPSLIKSVEKIRETLLKDPVIGRLSLKAHKYMLKMTRFTIE